MSEFVDLVRPVHGVTQLVIVTSGAGALGFTAAASLRSRSLGGPSSGRRSSGRGSFSGSFSKRSLAAAGRRALQVCCAALLAQIGLGILLVVAADAASPPFDGDGATLVWHAAGGVLALVFAGFALRQVRRSGDEAHPRRAALVWLALAVLSVGNLPIAVMVTGAVLGLSLVASAIQQQPHAQQQDPGGQGESEEAQGPDVGVLDGSQSVP